MKIDLKLIVILFLNLFLSATYSMPFSIFPVISLSRDVSLGMIGFIFSLFPLGSIIISLIFAKMMKVWGRVRLLIITSILLGISTFIFGIIIRIEDNTTFVVVACISRVIQGMACGGFCTVAYAIIALLYRDSILEKETYMVLFFTVGVAVGPVIGGVLYEHVNYEFPNYLFAGISFLTIPAVFLIPQTADGSKETEKKPVKISNFMKNSRFVFTVGLIVVNFSGFTFIYAAIVKHMETFNCGPTTAGLFIAEIIMSYFGSMVLLNFLPKSIDRRVWLFVGCCLEFLSFFLAGPEPYLLFPKSLVFVGIGLFLVGFGGGLSILPILPELIDVGTYHVKEDEEAVGDMASAFNNMGFQVGEFFGPILGSQFTSVVGFEHGCSLYSIVILLYTITYLIFGKGFEAFGHKRRASRANTGLQLTPSQNDKYTKLISDTQDLNDKYTKLANDL